MLICSGCKTSNTIRRTRNTLKIEYPAMMALGDLRLNIFAITYQSVVNTSPNTISKTARLVGSLEFEPSTNNKRSTANAVNTDIVVKILKHVSQ